MTSQDALAGFQRLQRHFKGRPYKGADLNPIWSELLRCRVEAFDKAIGILVMHGKFLPSPDYVLEQTKQWDKRMEYEPAPIGRGPAGDLGSESIRLTRGYLDGTLPLEEYVRSLYWLSERTGNVEYAEEARRKEKMLMHSEERE